VVAVMRLLPTWSKLKKLAPTLAYDLALMEGTQSGGPLPDRWPCVAAPKLTECRLTCTAQGLSCRSVTNEVHDTSAWSKRWSRR
jgi:hypothetical protein